MQPPLILRKTNKIHHPITLFPSSTTKHHTNISYSPYLYYFHYLHPSCPQNIKPLDIQPIPFPPSTYYHLVCRYWLPVVQLNKCQWTVSQLQSLLFHMLRRIPQVHTLPNSLYPPVSTRPYKPSPNNSTDQSADESLETRACKEKSQLCKRFMENGYCPYQKRCKFAHGSEELRRNDQQNFKYKTKECGSFKNHQFCVYGDRCNFIHITTPPKLLRTNPEEEERESGPDVEMGMIRSLGAKSSRLMGKLF